jgi:hypothetical protein
MGMTVMLTDAMGSRKSEVVDDPKNYLHRLLPLCSADRSLLRYVDWYGETVFNRQQAGDFLQDWECLYDFIASEDERILIDSVAALARRLSESAHSYLRFIGD